MNQFKFKVFSESIFTRAVAQLPEPKTPMLFFFILTDF